MPVLEISDTDLLACAEAAARDAGQYALRNAHRRTETVAVKAHDVKLKLDIECQARIEGVIRGAFPAHTTLGEEDDHAPADTAPADAGRFCPQSMGRYLWIIDPIDGTVNFSHGMRQWCVSVAVLRDDRVLAGCVYAPALDACYTATHTSPALRNGEAIRVSDTPRLAEAIVRTGIDRNEDFGVPPFTCMNAIALRARRIRVMGSAALDLCAVAAGEAEGYFENSIFVWDVAAAGLVVRAAGGQAGLFGRRSGHGILYMGTNGLVADELDRLLRAVLA